MLAVKYVVVDYGAVAALPIFGTGINPLDAAVLIFKEKLRCKPRLAQPMQSLQERKAVERVMVIMIPALAQGYAYGVGALIKAGGYVVNAVLHALVIGGPAGIKHGVSLPDAVYAYYIIAYSRN